MVGLSPPHTSYTCWYVSPHIRTHISNVPLGLFYWKQLKYHVPVPSIIPNLFVWRSSFLYIFSDDKDTVQLQTVLSLCILRLIVYFNLHGNKCCFNVCTMKIQLQRMHYGQRKLWRYFLFITYTFWIILDPSPSKNDGVAHIKQTACKHTQISFSILSWQNRYHTTGM